LDCLGLNSRDHLRRLGKKEKSKYASNNSTTNAIQCFTVHLVSPVRLQLLQVDQPDGQDDPPALTSVTISAVLSPPSFSGVGSTAFRGRSRAYSCSSSSWRRARARQARAPEWRGTPSKPPRSAR